MLTYIMSSSESLPMYLIKHLYVLILLFTSKLYLIQNCHLRNCIDIFTAFILLFTCKLQNRYKDQGKYGEDISAIPELDEVPAFIKQDGHILWYGFYYTECTTPPRFNIHLIPRFTYPS